MRCPIARRTFGLFGPDCWTASTNRFQGGELEIYSSVENMFRPLYTCPVRWSGTVEFSRDTELRKTSRCGMIGQFGSSRIFLISFHFPSVLCRCFPLFTVPSSTITNHQAFLQVCQTLLHNTHTDSETLSVVKAQESAAFSSLYPIKSCVHPSAVLKPTVCILCIRPSHPSASIRRSRCKLLAYRGNLVVHTQDLTVDSPPTAYAISPAPRYLSGSTVDFCMSSTATARGCSSVPYEVDSRHFPYL